MAYYILGDVCYEIPGNICLNNIIPHADVMTKIIEHLLNNQKHLITFPMIVLHKWNPLQCSACIFFIFPLNILPCIIAI